MNQHTCLLSFHGAHVARLSRLSSKCQFRFGLMQRKDWFRCSPYGDNLSDWHLQELARKVHAWQVEDSSPTSHEVTQIDLAFIPSEHGNLHCCFHPTFHASSRLLWKALPFPFIPVPSASPENVKCKSFDAWQASLVGNCEQVLSSIAIYNSIMYSI